MSLRHADAFARVAARLRARGFEVDEQPGWRTRGSRGRSLVEVQGVMLHHTVDNPPSDYPSLRIVRDGRSDLPGPLAQWGVGRSGRILLIAAGLANHAGRTAYGWQQNSRCVGIESANKGTGAERWPARSMAAQRALVEELGREFGFGASRVVGHKEAAVPRGRKVDPAYDVDEFRRSLTFGAAAAPAPTPDPEDDDMTPEQATRQARIEQKLDILLEKHEATSTVVADARGHAKAVRELLQPGGYIRAKLDNVEAVAARGKNLTIDLVGAAAVTLAGVQNTPAATVRELVARLSRTAADEPQAEVTK